MEEVNERSTRSRKTNIFDEEVIDANTNTSSLNDYYSSLLLDEPLPTDNEHVDFNEADSLAELLGPSNDLQHTKIDLSPVPVITVPVTTDRQSASHDVAQVSIQTVLLPTLDEVEDAILDEIERREDKLFSLSCYTIQHDGHEVMVDDYKNYLYDALYDALSDWSDKLEDGIDSMSFIMADALADKVDALLTQAILRAYTVSISNEQDQREVTRAGCLAAIGLFKALTQSTHLRHHSRNLLNTVAKKLHVGQAEDNRLAAIVEAAQRHVDSEFPPVANVKKPAAGIAAPVAASGVGAASIGPRVSAGATSILTQRDLLRQVKDEAFNPSDLL